jgi:hypothetical protein
MLADGTRSGGARAHLAFALMANLAPIGTFAAVLPEVSGGRTK